MQTKVLYYSKVLFLLLTLSYILFSIRPQTQEVINSQPSIIKPVDQEMTPEQKCNKGENIPLYKEGKYIACQRVEEI